MAPVKQEEQMKERLEKRSLQPSPESWAMLSNRLDAEQKNKSKSLFWWIGIAASIVGIIFVTTMYFMNQPIENDLQIIVDTEENGIQSKHQTIENRISEVSAKSNEFVVEKTNPEDKSQNRNISNSNIKTTTVEKNGIIEELPIQDAVAEHQGKSQEKLSDSSQVDTLTEINTPKLNFEEQKIQDVVAQINSLKANGNAVTDAEIDNLLKKAQKEILSNKLYNENTRTVDAKALLQDVEDDLQQSFRSKVFEALQSGYESVRTAVAERNN